MSNQRAEPTTRPPEPARVEEFVNAPNNFFSLFSGISEYGELKNCKRRPWRDTRDGKAYKAATHRLEAVELNRGSVIVGRAVYHGPELLAVQGSFQAIAIWLRRAGWLSEPLPVVAVDMDLSRRTVRSGIEDHPARIDHELLIWVIGIAGAKVKREPGMGVAFGGLPPRAHVIVESVLRIPARSGAAGRISVPVD